MKRTVFPHMFIAIFLVFQTFAVAHAHAKSPASEIVNSPSSTPISGCPIFPANNIWNVPIDQLPIHARSAQWVNSIGRSTGFHMDFGQGKWDGGAIGIPYNVVGSSVPKVSVQFEYDDESDTGPYPIPSNPLTEYGSDHHILILDNSTCTLYELFYAYRSSGKWSAGSGAIWDLNSNALRPDTWTSADAAGLPILPGLVRYDEILSGEINHAIRFTASRTNGYIWPARHLTTDNPSAPQIPPMGARFRLKESFDISGYPSEMQIILTAMKTYGIILADNGSNWYVSGAPDERWNNDMLHLLDDLTGDDFEAVDVSSLMIDSDSGAVGYSISGNAGAAGVTLSYTDGIPRTVKSQANGNYSFAVTSGWGGTVTPSHPCFSFMPDGITYSDVTENITGQDYTTTPAGLCVSSIARVNNSPTNAATVDFTVTFTESVTGVDAGDFVLTKTGLTGTSIVNVSGPDDVYTVTVNTGSGNGTLRLDLIDNDSIRNDVNDPLGGSGNGNGDFDTGEEYSIIKSAPKPSVPVLLTPANGMLVTTLSPILDWKDSTPPAHHYQVQVSTNNTFTGVVINETDVTSSTFTPPLLPGKLYYWRVRAFNIAGGASAWSAIWSFKTPLAQPTLVSPIENIPLLIDRPTLDWNSVEGATQYIVQVSASNTFSTLLLNVTVNTDSYTLTKDLPQNKTLFWRVRAKSPAVMSPWSGKGSFKTGNPPSVPVLVSPANGVLVKTYTPLLNWNNSTLPAGTLQYELQIAESKDFSSPVTETTTVSQFTPGTDLNANTRYYWRVRAISTIDLQEHVSGWSPVWSFRTVIAAPTELSVNDPTSRTPKFDWEDATGTIVNYTLQISTSASFSTFLVNSTPTLSEYQVLKALPTGKTLYWRVRVNGPNGPSAWSMKQYQLP